jgi:hypothetical protein
VPERDVDLDELPEPPDARSPAANVIEARLPVVRFETCARISP